MIDSNETLIYDSGWHAGYDAGYENGRKESSNMEITMINPKPSDVIIISFKDISCEAMQDIIICTRRLFPDNEVIGLFNNSIIDTWTKKNLEDYIKYLQNRLSKMKGENK